MVRAEEGILVVGSYCHDILFLDDQVMGESLGGAASFVSNVLDPLSPLPSRYVSKVGSDFAYPVSHPPLVTTSPTTIFHAHFSSHDGVYHGDRVLKRVRACQAISPADLPGGCRFDFGLAVGVAGEVTPATLGRMLDICRVVFVDVQALIRTFDPVNGTVGMIPLRESGFSHLLPRVGFLKASADEAPFVDIDEARKWCAVVVTEGKDGCTVYWKDGDTRIPPFPTVQIDPTGAGDSFLGGFVVGLIWGLPIQEAALLGNFFGSLTVAQVGVPKFELSMLQKVQEKLERKEDDSFGSYSRNIAASSYRSGTDEELRDFLTEALKLCTDSLTGSSNDNLACETI